jgi:CheY-like chemotaxis protein
LGRGASFWIELPLATAGRQEHHAFQQATQFKDSALSVPLEPAASLPIDQEESAKQRVLLVEDNLVNRKVVGGLLERQGYQVDTVVDGVEAVEACEATVFDAILMDIQMPRMDGLEATRTIRALGGRHARVPIIALTANVMLEDSRECLDAGMDAFLSKPVKPQVLYDAVRGQISRARSLAMLNDREAGLDAAGRASKPLVPPVQELVGRTLDALRGDLGDDLLAELLADFMAQAGQAADLLQTLKFSGGAPTVERDQLRRSCHDLRATAQNCGLMQLAVLSAELEQVFCCGDLPKAAKINDFSAALEAARNRLVEHFPPLKGLLWA